MNLNPDMVASFYKFVDIDDPEAIRPKLRERAVELNLMGTILLASEGINGMLSGSRESLEILQKELDESFALGPLEFKLSDFKGTAFRRMLVKVKPEIITMRQNVNPLKKTGKRLDPLELQRWYEQSKDMLVLDTRNDYEVALGTFKDAIDPKISSFEQFTSYVDEHVEELKKKPVVTFCTGGVRCEKATAYMMDRGIEDVYQLEGGILKYFEATKDHDQKSYWQGDCVVFDKRKAVDPDLNPSKKDICYICLFEMSCEEIHPSPGPGGTMCRSCADKVSKNRELRERRGQEKALVHRQERTALLKKVAARYQEERALAQAAHDS